MKSHPLVATSLSSIAIIVLSLNLIFFYLMTYYLDDCDDKANHYFWSSYVYSSESKQQLLDQHLERLLRQDPTNIHSQRIQFRLDSTNNYPLANILIHVLPHYDDYSTTTKQSFLILTIIGLIFYMLAQYLAKGDQILFLLSLNITALFPIEFFFPINNMIPFKVYVPRGIGAIAIIPLIYALTKRNYKLTSTIIIFTALVHTGQAGIYLAIAVATSLILFILDHYRKIPQLTKITSYFKVNSQQGNFFKGMLIATIICLIIIVTSLLLEAYIPGYATLWGRSSIPIMSELPRRMGGITIPLVIMLALQGFSTVTSIFTYRNRKITYTLALIIGTIAIYRYHFLSYKLAFAGHLNFFQSDCDIVDSTQSNLNTLNITNEAQFWVTAANFLNN